MPRGFFGVDDDDEQDQAKAEALAKMSGSSIAMARANDDDGSDTSSITAPKSALSNAVISPRDKPSSASQLPAKEKPSSGSQSVKDEVKPERKVSYHEGDLNRDNKGIWGSHSSSTRLSRQMDGDEAQPSQEPTRTSEPKANSIDDSVLVKDLILTLAKEFGWFPDEVQADIEYMSSQRLRTVKNLRQLTPASWKELNGIPVVVRDCLKQFINA